MKNLLRWQYAAPRVLAMLVALLAFQYVLGLIGRARIRDAIAAATGAQGDVAGVRVSFVDGRVTLANLQIADPRHPKQDLLSAENGDFIVDTGAFVRRGAIAGHGRLSGVKFLTPREMNETLGNSPTPAVTRVISVGGDQSQAVSDWIKAVDAKFAAGPLPSSASAKLLAELSDSSAKELAQLEARLQNLQALGEQLRAQAAANEQNLLRRENQIASLPQQLRALQAESAQVAAQIEMLPERFDAARRTIVAVRVRDDRRLREWLCENPSISESLAAYLLRQQATTVATEVVAWLDWTRSIVPAKASAADGARPGLLLHTVDFEGTTSIAGQAVPLHGVLTDFTAQPWLVGRPMRLKLTSSGTPKIDIRATIDRTGDKARDEVLVDCHRLRLGPLILGERDGIRVASGESPAEINVSIQLVGDRLTGEIQIVQNDIQISSSVGDDFAHVPLASPLQQTLGDLDSIAMRYSLRGTLAKPQYTVWSSIGPAAAKAVDLAITRAAADHADQVTAEMQQRGDERLAQLDRKIADGQAQLLPRLAACGSQLSSLAAQYATPARLDADHLGRLPNGSLFR